MGNRWFCTVVGSRQESHAMIVLGKLYMIMICGFSSLMTQLTNSGLSLLDYEIVFRHQRVVALSVQLRGNVAL